MKKRQYILILFLLLTLCFLSSLSAATNNIQPTTQHTHLKQDLSASPQAQQVTASNKYYFIPIAAGLILLYLFSWLCTRKKILPLSTHRKLWNILLLITFFISALLGFILAIRISFSLAFPYLSTMIFWHVEFGIAMAMISLFHIIWHRKYFKKIILP